MLAFLFWLLITPTPGVPGIELDVSDPQQINDFLIKQCLAYNGKCNIWYLPGTYRIYKPVSIPPGVQNVYFQNTVVVPCGQMGYAFLVQSNYPSPSPKFHDLKIDSSKPCGTFTPPLHYAVQFP